MERASKAGRLTWLRWPVTVGPWRRDAEGRRAAAVAVAGLRRPAALASTILLVSMAVVGLVTAVVCANWAERPAGEGPGTLGVEAGAALWFGGAVALTLRGTTTVRRVLLVLVTGAFGGALIAIALWRGWSGAPLTLAMELGVGAVALVIVDLVVLGTVTPGLRRIAEAGGSVNVLLRWAWPPVRLSTERADDAGG